MGCSGIIWPSLLITPVFLASGNVEFEWLARGLLHWPLELCKPFPPLLSVAKVVLVRRRARSWFSSSCLQWANIHWSCPPERRPPVWSKLFLRAGIESFNTQVFFSEDIKLDVEIRSCNVIKYVCVYWTVKCVQEKGEYSIKRNYLAALEKWAQWYLLVMQKHAELWIACSFNGGFRLCLGLNSDN